MATGRHTKVISPEWFELPEVRAAARDAAEDPGRFFEALIAYVDMRETLQGVLGEYGLTRDALDDLLSRARALEGATGHARTVEARDVIRTLMMRGVPGDIVQRLVPEDQAHLVNRVSSRTDVNRNRDIVRLTGEGHIPVDIASILSVPRSTVFTVLEQAGVTPARRSRVVTADDRERAFMLLDGGMSMRKTAAVVGCTVDQVRTMRKAPR